MVGFACWLFCLCWRLNLADYVLRDGRHVSRPSCVLDCAKFTCVAVFLFVSCRKLLVWTSASYPCARRSKGQFFTGAILAHSSRHLFSPCGRNRLVHGRRPVVAAHGLQCGQTARSTHRSRRSSVGLRKLTC